MHYYCSRVGDEEGPLPTCLGGWGSKSRGNGAFSTGAPSSLTMVGSSLTWQQRGRARRSGEDSLPRQVHGVLADCPFSGAGRVGGGRTGRWASERVGSQIPWVGTQSLGIFFLGQIFNSSPRPGFKFTRSLFTPSQLKIP